jgi:DNA-binding GntR family transcriptional regulator
MDAMKSGALGEDSDGAPLTLHASVYDELRQWLILGKVAPGAGMSTRVLAQQLGVSQMPVRDALSRLAAEGAVVVRSKRKIVVTPMTQKRLNEIIDCRLLIEPAAAAAALPYLNAAKLRQLKAIDRALDEAGALGATNDYIEQNYRFHFTLYRAGGDTMLTRIIETLWVQFGPLMRVVYGRVGTRNLVDKHHLAIDAIAAQDQAALGAAIAADIEDARGLIIDENGEIDIAA